MYISKSKTPKLIEESACFEPLLKRRFHGKTIKNLYFETIETKKYENKLLKVQMCTCSHIIITHKYPQSKYKIHIHAPAKGSKKNIFIKFMLCTYISYIRTIITERKFNSVFSFSMFVYVSNFEKINISSRNNFLSGGNMNNYNINRKSSTNIHKFNVF